MSKNKFSNFADVSAPPKPNLEINGIAHKKAYIAFSPHFDYISPHVLEHGHKISPIITQHFSWSGGPHMLQVSGTQVFLLSTEPPSLLSKIWIPRCTYTPPISCISLQTPPRKSNLLFRWLRDNQSRNKKTNRRINADMEINRRKNFYDFYSWMLPKILKRKLATPHGHTRVLTDSHSHRLL